MQKAQMNNSTWPFHTNENANSGNPWPELCQKNEVKHSARKKDAANAKEGLNVVPLDNFEFPELGGTVVKNKNSIVPRDHCMSRPDNVQILVPMQTNMESKRSKCIKRYKRSDKICINLQEALQNTIYANKMSKEVPKLRINLLYMGNLGFTIPNTMEKNKCSDFRKVRICISKDKKPSKLKKIILLNRDIKAQINIEKRAAFERRKMDAICKDVDTINFDALKITPDSERNTDYVRNMWTMTLYDKNYRNINEMNISDDTLSHRPDVIERINDLGIQGRQLTNRLIGKRNRTSFSNLVTDIVENEIIKQTFSLKIEDGIKQENQNITEIDDKNFIKFSNNFREYCTNVLTKGLNDSLEKFLQEITRLQKRSYEKNPNKSKYKRRYYSGLKEVRKHAELKKLKLVIIAPDIEKVELDDGLDDQIYKMVDTCKRQNVVFCFGLRRRKLGYYTHGRGFVGCIGIANYSGTEPLFEHVLIELVHARNTFEKLNGAMETNIDISKVISENFLLSENIDALLKILSHNMHP
ncbi:PREDICTED: uncharacterized protein LOC108554251 [Eufriesea mexicana]|uniref:uncharacterized protein LOC108554251 n=1 Tax=Eufriesea mexicana TaxID=516756 RepID=UPI00083C231E|nr:PREDICTED: uncharacterized protein LOC108554251 [Eufriesea mexicana]